MVAEALGDDGHTKNATQCHLNSSFVVLDYARRTRDLPTRSEATKLQSRSAISIKQIENTLKVIDRVVRRQLVGSMVLSGRRGPMGPFICLYLVRGKDVAIDFFH
jgi:hypothetical protein